MAELRRLRQEKAKLQAMLQNHLVVCPSLLLQTDWIFTVDKFVNYCAGLHVEFSMYILLNKCTRCCPVHCTFCSTSVSEVVEYIVRSVQQVYQKLYIDTLCFCTMEICLLYTHTQCECVFVYYLIPREMYVQGIHSDLYRYM